MSVPSDHPTVRQAPVARVALWVFGAVLGVGAAGLVGALLLDPSGASSAGAGLGACLLGAMLGLVPLLLAPAGAPLALATAQVVGSSVRMLASAGAGVALLLLGGFDPVWTLGLVLAATATALVAELLVIFPALGGRPARATEAAT